MDWCRELASTKWSQKICLAISLRVYFEKKLFVISAAFQLTINRNSLKSTQGHLETCFSSIIAWVSESKPLMSFWPFPRRNNYITCRNMHITFLLESSKSIGFFKQKIVSMSTYLWYRTATLTTNFFFKTTRYNLICPLQLSHRHV